jgi:hypothetical protein
MITLGFARKFGLYFPAGDRAFARHAAACPDGSRLPAGFTADTAVAGGAHERLRAAIRVDPEHGVEKAGAIFFPDSGPGG